jgi:hypothetical protein
MIIRITIVKKVIGLSVKLINPNNHIKLHNKKNKAKKRSHQQIFPISIIITTQLFLKTKTSSTNLT